MSKHPPGTFKTVDVDHIFDPTRLIGTGSFSKVYLGRQLSSSQPVAIKEIRKRTEQQFYENALNEIQILRLLNHKNIVAIKKVIDHKDTLFVVMQLCQGVTLDKYLKLHRRLPEGIALSIFDQLLSALKHVLEEHIMHRDIKPANIVYHDGNVKLLDFGFAAVLEDIEEEILDHLGTPLYMSPQILSRSSYSSKSDIWSLGVMLFEMVYGQTPWKPRTTKELLHLIKFKPLEFPSEPEVSLITKFLIKQCLEVSESKRISWESLFRRISSPSLGGCKSKSKIELMSKESQTLSVRCGPFFC